MSLVFNKIYLLLWKNALLRKRHLFLSFCEIVLPIVMFVLVAYCRSKINYFGKEYVNTSTYNEPISTVHFQITNCKVLFAPKTNFTLSLMEKINEKIFYSANDSLGFNTESDLLTYYETIGTKYKVMAIIFKNSPLNTTPKLLNYEIRPHEEFVRWHTDQLFSNSLTYIPGIGAENYINKGFIPLKLAIDTAFIEILSEVSLPYFSLQEFPYPPHLNDLGIGELFSNFLPIITIFGFITLCLSVLKRVVEEKSLGVKELTKILGLKSWMHWTGWFITAFIPSLITIVIIVLLMKVKLWGAPYPSIEYCDFSVLFVFLTFYSITVISFSFAFSTLFSKPTIAMISGILLWLVPYFILKSIIGKYPFLRWYLKSIMCLFPNMALEFGFKAIQVYEGREIGLQWSNIMVSGTESTEDMTMFNVLIMFIVDTIFYMILTLYIDNINPGPYGIARPYLYPLQKLKKFILIFKKESKVEDDCKPIKEDVPENIEPADFLKPGIKIKNLKKNYDSKTAISGLTMNIYEDQITALLGHNGAGKTTTLSILTGMIQATSGEVIIKNCVIDSKSGSNGIDQIRSYLGLCPQQNLHFRDLTVFEHLMFFGMLRGNSYKEVKREAEELLVKLNLHNKRNNLPFTLSGGMKRKLSLGIALIGHSKILILDEPTSGLDPEARREIWDLLLAMRGSRTIILSTHFMEEADILGDRIAIMNHGRLECYGTSMFLKNIYGTGYHLTLIINSEIENNMQENRKAFSKIEEIVKNCIPQASIKQQRGNSCTFLLPVESKSDYGKLLEDLELNKEKYNISNINITYTTLEEVFLRVENMAAKHKGRESSESGSDYLKTSTDLKKKGFQLFLQQITMLSKKKFLVLKKLRKITVLQILLPLFLTLKTVYLSSSNSGKTLDKEPGLPLDLSIYGKPFVFYNNPPFSMKNLSNQYDSIVSAQNGIPIQVDSVSDAIIKKGIENIVSYKTHLIVAAEFNKTDRGSVLNAMYANSAIHAAPISVNLIMNALIKSLMGSDYGITVKNNPLPAAVTSALSDIQSEIEVGMLWMFLFPLGLLFSISGFILFPQMENTSNSKQLQLMCGIRPFFYWMTTYLFDLLFYAAVVLLQLFFLSIMFTLMSIKSEAVIGGPEVGALLAIMIAYGIAAIPYSYLFSYYKSAASAFAVFIISSLFIGITLTVIVLVFEKSGDAYYIHISDVLKYLFALLPQFGVTYTSVHFSLLAVSNYNWKITPMDRRKHQCHFDYNPCCDGDNTVNCKIYQSYFQSPEYGILNQLMIMMASTIVFLVIVTILETHFYKKLRDWIYSSITQCINPDNSILQLDDEVKVENERVHNTLKREKSVKEQDVGDYAKVTRDVLLVDNLQKTFGRKRVVKGVSFGVGKRGCFGLLGVNGAGKTTTFRMLTGSEPCTGGDARIYDNAFFGINDKEYLQRVGYCPQFDAINELLSGRSILELFAKLRGLSGQECDNEVEFWINTLGLTEWADQPCGEYSGGNKRKLSMAIALIGNQPVTMLDEPTSGVDPVSRRKLWNVLTEIQMEDSRNSNPIVLTSHSMEECEVLCNKLAIMKDGVLQCIGTIPQLKRKFGQGFTVQLKLKPILNVVTETDDDQEELLKESSGNKKVDILKKEFSKQYYSCVLKDEHSGLLHYHINDLSITWGKLFKEIEELKKRHSIIEDYNISETTLEEIFLTIARSK